MKLGAGKLPDDALLFGDLNGNPPSPNPFSAAWSDFAPSKQMSIWVQIGSKAQSVANLFSSE
jgi:hypothetical protein